MLQEFRKCGGNDQFNTGNSRCPYNPEKIKAIILIEQGYRLPEELTFENIRKAIHADRPDRIYPIGTIIEYALNGGDAQTSPVGYGPTKVTGYAARTDTFTLEKFDQGVRANVMKMKNIPMTAYYIDENGLLIGQRGANGEFNGFELSGVYPSGQEIASSGQTSQLLINLMFKDIERSMKNVAYKEPKFDILDELNGLVYVDLLKLDSPANAYKIKDHYNDIDLTAYYKDGLISSDNWTGATLITYDNDKEAFLITGTNPRLAAPSVLYENNVYGIEQFN